MTARGPQRQAFDSVAWFRGLPPGSVCLITGAPGCGKTRIVQQADAGGAFRRRIVFDPYGYRDRLEEARGKVCSPWRGDLGTARGLLELVHGGEPILDQDPLQLVVSARDLRPKSLGRDFAAVADLAWSTGDVDLVAEESGLYSRQARDLIMRVASGGRHAGMRLFLIVQSIGRLDIDGRRHLTHGLFGPLSEAGDRDDVRSRCGEAFAAQVAALQLGQPLLPWQLGQGFTQGSTP